MKDIKVGVVGVGRGMSFAMGAQYAGMKLVAICDIWEEKLKEAGKKLNVSIYTDYDKFLQHDMDAVILANYFHQHAPFAIKALKAGKHVMSETACNSTIAEGVELCRTVEKTGLIYMLAENYPFTVFNMEMRRLYKSGEIGEVTYAEGEYNHPMNPESRCLISPGLNHWRNWMPPTYYCTHALAPLVYITERMPVKVNALSIARPSINRHTSRRADPGFVILCRMDNGSVFRLFGLLLPGHSNWYRIHGEKGAMEITRGPGYFGSGQIRVWHEHWTKKKGQLLEKTYLPEWPEKGKLADRAGHGGGDFWTNWYFGQAIRTKKQPFLDVYKGVAMSSVGILAWKSALEDGKPYEVPDFTKESERKKYEKDDASPFPDATTSHRMPPSILGFIEPEPGDVVFARKVWKKIGYRDNDL
ncbi:MAG: Gfo/Idh/MocA family oxidoreductase [Candidatus Omnitrophica bacterium]|nr:Gfo/Idh/MocA family oxidoreductase [Candidatus Omnitrophota bacterium]MCM8824589.1 Gfo/Idh/MocA family oxidoreductase [Candidatus Omnitrophota bacterium]